MENLPNGYLPIQADGRPQKGKVLGPYNTLVYGIHSEEDPA